MVQDALLVAVRFSLVAVLCCRMGHASARLYCAINAIIAFSELLVEPAFLALSKGGGLSAEVGRSSKAASYKGRGGLGKEIEAPCADLCNLYAVPHSHAQESAMRYVGDVAKLIICTRIGRRKTTQKPKQNPNHKQSCGS
jgi:hypothetical protein